MSLKPSMSTPSSSSVSFTARRVKSFSRDTRISTSARWRMGREMSFWSWEARSRAASSEASPTMTTTRA